ncbi:MAG: hypothetical protein QOJ44_1337 [Acidimicrobiaceae bacterium]|jgi:hypothetical protein|nr:hypothetical protein [Acidimicrobiaceae bacterium]
MWRREPARVVAQWSDQARWLRIGHPIGEDAGLPAPRPNITSRPSCARWARAAYDARVALFVSIVKGPNATGPVPRFCGNPGR